MEKANSIRARIEREELLQRQRAAARLNQEAETRQHNLEVGRIVASVAGNSLESLLCSEDIRHSRDFMALMAERGYPNIESINRDSERRRHDATLPNIPKQRWLANLAFGQNYFLFEGYNIGKFIYENWHDEIYLAKDLRIRTIKGGTVPTGPALELKFGVTLAVESGYHGTTGDPTYKSEFRQMPLVDVLTFRATGALPHLKT